MHHHCQVLQGVQVAVEAAFGEVPLWLEEVLHEGAGIIKVDTILAECNQASDRVVELDDSESKVIQVWYSLRPRLPRLAAVANLKLVIEIHVSNFDHDLR